MPWVDIAEAAFTLGVSERTIRNWIKSGKLEARNANGRREVNIPDAEDSQRAHAFSEEDEEGGIDTQKRLEVALIECGRVKGTLASQERMMETLSSNIAELNAKLQRSERTISRRTIWCLAVAFIGVLTVLLVRYFDDATLNKARLTHAQERDDLRDQHQSRESKLHETYLGKISENDKAHRKEIEDLKLKLGQEKMQAIADVKKELQALHDKELGRVLEEKKEIETELKESTTARIRAEEQLRVSQKELEFAEKRLADAEHRVEELEKTRSELEAEVVRLKKGE